MASQNERKTIVPWFSMAEWDVTYKNIYSGDTKLQLLAYERLLAWKARCPRLPIAVECTMGMLQVLIKDQELVAQIGDSFMHPYQEYDLRLLYSTSVMRFLNQIAVLAQSSSDTLYQAARKMYVPDWFVGLRHDIAHGATLPPLAILRKAAQFALTWLHEYYWKGEAAASFDFVATEAELDASDGPDELKQLLELWQALKLYSLSECRSLGQIPDETLRKYLRQIMKSKKGQGSKVANTPEAINDDDVTFQLDKPHRKKYYGITDNADGVMSIKNAATNVKEKLLALIKRNMSAPGLCDRLVDHLLSGHVFIPSASLWEMFRRHQEGDEEHLAPWLIEIWKPMLNSLQQNLNILPVLLRRLAAATTDTKLEEHQQWVAALWLKELFAGCTKAQTIFQVANSEFSLSPGTNISKEIWHQAERLVLKKHPHLDRILSIKISEFPNPFISVVDVKEVLLLPSKWTHIFLPEMLESLNLPNELRQNLISLVSIYTQDMNAYDVDPEEDTDEEQVHTVSELEENMPKVVAEDAVSFASGCVKENCSKWKKSAENHSWARCPLGVLPWQKEKKVLDLDFDSSVLWQPLKVQEPQGPRNYNKNELPKQIDWNKVLKKRIRKGRIMKRKKKVNNVLKNAFQMVFSAT